MIVKGKSRSNGAQLGPYLMHSEENEAVHVLEVSGLGTRDVCEALIEMQEITDSGQRGVKGLYHSVLSPQPGYQVDETQWIMAADTLAAELNLKGQPRVVVLHEKNERIHAHVVFQRTDGETLTLIPDSWNYVAHEKAARKLERLWDHELVPGAHVEPRKDRRDDHHRHYDDDHHQARSSRISREERVAQVSELYARSDGPKAFVSALELEGYMIARGDRRDYVMLDGEGRVFSIPRYLKGVKTREFRRFMEPLPPERLLSVTEAKAEIDRRIETRKSPDKHKAKEAHARAAGERAGPETVRQKQNSKSKAKRAMARAAPGQNWQRYASAWRDRMAASRNVARSLSRRIRDRFTRIAGTAKERFANLKKRIVDRRDSSQADKLRLKDQFADRANSKAKRAAARVNKAQDRGPEHDR